MDRMSSPMGIFLHDGSSSLVAALITGTGASELQGARMQLIEPRHWYIAKTAF